MLMGPWVHSDFSTFRTRLSARPTLHTQALVPCLLCVSASRDTEEVAAQRAPYCRPLEITAARPKTGGGGRGGRRWRLQGSKPRLQGWTFSSFWVLASFVKRQLLNLANLVSSLSGFFCFYIRLPRKLGHGAICFGINLGDTWGRTHESKEVSWILIDWKGPQLPCVAYGSNLDLRHHLTVVFSNLKLEKWKSKMVGSIAQRHETWANNSSQQDSSPPFSFDVWKKLES